MCGRSENCHSLDPLGLRHPVRMALFSGEKTVTFVLENVTVQLASKIGPRPTNVCLKDVMMWTLVGNYFPIWGMGRSDVEADCTIWPLDVPTHTFGSAGSEFWYGNSGAM